MLVIRNNRIIKITVIISFMNSSLNLDIIRINGKLLTLIMSSDYLSTVLSVIEKPTPICSIKHWGVALDYLNKVNLHALPANDRTYLADIWLEEEDCPQLILRKRKGKYKLILDTEDMPNYTISHLSLTTVEKFITDNAELWYDGYGNRIY